MGRGAREVAEADFGEVMHERQLDGVGPVDGRFASGEGPDQKDDVEDVLRDALRIGDAAQRIADARHSIERLELFEHVEKVALRNFEVPREVLFGLQIALGEYAAVVDLVAGHNERQSAHAYGPTAGLAGAFPALGVEALEEPQVVTAGQLEFFQ